MKTGDYCIAVISDKNQFCRVVATGKSVTKIEVVDTEEQHRIEIKSSIIAVLGPNPKSGTVFGVSTNYPRRVMDTNIGPARIMFNLRKEDWKIIRHGINKVSKCFIGDCLDDQMDIDIVRDGRASTGTYAKGRLMLKLPVIEKGGTTTAVAQAAASALWKHMDKTSLLRWYKIFKSYNKITVVESETLENMCEHVLRVGVKDYKKECDDVDLALFKECLGHISRTQRLDGAAVTALINSAGNDDLVREIWPSHADLRNSNHPFGDLSARSPKSLYTEAVVAFVLGSNMNPKIAKAIKATSIVSWPTKDKDSEAEAEAA